MNNLDLIFKEISPFLGELKGKKNCEISSKKTSESVIIEIKKDNTFPLTIRITAEFYKNEKPIFFAVDWDFFNAYCRLTENEAAKITMIVANEFVNYSDDNGRFRTLLQMICCCGI